MQDRPLAGLAAKNKNKKGSSLLCPTASDAGGYNLSEGEKVEPLLGCCMTSPTSTGVQKTESPTRHWAPAHARLSLRLTICFAPHSMETDPPRSHLGSIIMTSFMKNCFWLENCFN